MVEEVMEEDVQKDFFATPVEHQTGRGEDQELKDT
jgi:hypothetical protein